MIVLPKLDQFLSIIGDGTWHSLKELAKYLNIPKQKLITLSKLLAETNIVEYETQKSQVRIKKAWHQMLENSYNEQKGEKAAIGTVVLPPKKSINIQGIQVANLTEKELEINIRVNKKLKELAIGMLNT